MFFLGRRDFLCADFFLVSLEGFFMPLLCARALFFLRWARPLPLDAVTRLLDFLVFLFFYRLLYRHARLVVTDGFIQIGQSSLSISGHRRH